MNEILTLTVSQLFSLSRVTDKSSSLTNTGGSTMKSKIIDEMRSKYSNDEEEVKDDTYKQG